MLRDLQASIIVVCSLSIVIATKAIACRFWGRRLTRRPCHADDWLMVVAYLNTLLFLITAIYGLFVLQYGKHEWNISADERITLEKHPGSRFALNGFGILSMVFCNLSITQYYTTLFPHYRMRIACRVLQALTVCYGIISLVLHQIPCVRHRFGPPKAKLAPCTIDFASLLVYSSLSGMCLDLANVLLPMPIFWRLHVDFCKKLRLTLLFGFGFLIVGLTATRVYFFAVPDNHDKTYQAGRIILVNGPEPALGILAGCLPVMAPCFRLASEKIRSSLWCPKNSNDEENIVGEPASVIGAAEGNPSTAGKRFGLGNEMRCTV